MVPLLIRGFFLAVAVVLVGLASAMAPEGLRIEGWEALEEVVAFRRGNAIVMSVGIGIHGNAMFGTSAYENVTTREISEIRETSRLFIILEIENVTWLVRRAMEGQWIGHRGNALILQGGVTTVVHPEDRLAGLRLGLCLDEEPVGETGITFGLIRITGIPAVTGICIPVVEVFFPAAWMYEDVMGPVGLGRGKEGSDREAEVEGSYWVGGSVTCRKKSKEKNESVK